MGVIVYTNPVNLKYKTVLCSKATAFYLICTLLTIIPPLLVAYRSEGNISYIFFNHYIFSRKRFLFIDMYYLNSYRFLEENRCIPWTTRCPLRIRISAASGNWLWKPWLEYLPWLQRTATRASQSANPKGFENIDFLWS